MTNPERHDLLRELLGVYALGALSEFEHAVVRRHLARCPGCSQELAELVPVVALLSSIDPESIDHDLLTSATAEPESARDPATSHEYE